MSNIFTSLVLAGAISFGSSTIPANDSTTLQNSELETLVEQLVNQDNGDMSKCCCSCPKPKPKC
jgi:hypothetical protein